MMGSICLPVQTPDQLIEWIEAGLTAARVRKIVPEIATLESAARDMAKDEIAGAMLEEEADRIEEAVGSLELEGIDAEIRDTLAQYPERSWDQALRPIVKKLAARCLLGDGPGDGSRARAAIRRAASGLT